MLDDETYLVAYLDWQDDDGRIGMRARPIHPPLRIEEFVKERDRWGYLEAIYQYADGSERWRVIEIGGMLNMLADNSSFELLPGTKKDYSYWDQQINERAELSDQQIYQMLLEAFEIRTYRMKERDEQMEMTLVRASSKIQVMLSKGTKRQSKIELEYLSMLKNWHENKDQLELRAKKTAQTIIRLRG